jgi:hypothetical protein
MPGTEPKYERIIRYLKGLLSNRERYDLEKEMMQDAFEEEAFDGLTRISADELESDMEQLGNRLKDRTKPERKRSLGIFYRIAAGIILLAGMAAVLYLVFRMPSRSLITEETGKAAQKSPPEIRMPSVTDTAFTKVAVPAKAESEIPSEAATEFPVKVKSEAKCIPVQIPPVMIEPPAQKAKEPVAARATENETISVTEEIAVRDAAEEKIAENDAVSEVDRQPSISRRKTEAAAPVAIEKPRSGFSGVKVVDTNGNPLPGVSITEKGSARSTVTGMDGMFSLQAFDSGAVLSLHSVGFVPVEMNAKDMAGKEISMTEDLMALDEVVVVGYGVQKKSDATGAVTVLSAEDISPGANAEISAFVNPVPPGGSVKAFKSWVSERLDDSIVRAFPEKQKILVTITIETDGSVKDIHMKETVPEPLAEEFRRIILKSPRWKPAMKDNTPVSAKIAIRFVTGTE